MRIAVVNNCVPFLRGGAEYLAEALCEKLIEHGHEAILVRLPLRWQPPRTILHSILTSRLLHFPNTDRVIALKFPAYYVRHPEKRVWLLHQFRQVYDLWGTPLQGLPDDPESRLLRNVIIRCDNQWLGEAAKIYTNSPVTQKRLKQFNNIDSEVLWPPLRDAAHFHPTEYGDYVFFPSRLNAAKRQWLAIEALSHARTPVKLVLAGPPDTPEEHQKLEQLAAKLGVADRVVLMARYISEAEKGELMSRALACLYPPYDEDSYGFVTLEAYAAAKPVITCIDSGGTLTLVRHEETGLVVDPIPDLLAAAMDRLYRARTEAQRMGEAGRKLVASMQISWHRVVEALTA
jgi:glycosyltransferase involved in cell wall biosynthesis